MSRDTNHATLDRYAEQSGVVVVPLHTIGGGTPDALYGYASTCRLVEYKRPPERKRWGLRTTKCKECRHEKKKHAGTGGVCSTCSTHAMMDNDPPEVCMRFVPDFGPIDKPRGRLDPDQKKWHARWPGCPIAKAETTDDVDRILDDMKAEGRDGR